MNLAVREWDEVVAFEKVKDALAEKIHDNADVATIVEAVPQMNASVPVGGIIRFQGGKDTELNA